MQLHFRLPHLKLKSQHHYKCVLSNVHIINGWNEFRSFSFLMCGSLDSYPLDTIISFQECNVSNNTWHRYENFVEICGFTWMEQFLPSLQWDCISMLIAFLLLSLFVQEFCTYFFTRSFYSSCYDITIISINVLKKYTIVRYD